MGNVLILAEVETDALSDVSLEALTFARSLGEPVSAVVVGDLPDGARAALADHGVGVVHRAVHDAFGSYAAAAVATAVVEAVERCGATILVAPGSPRGNEVCAHVAARLDVPMAANVVAVESADPLVVTRQVMGGAVLEDLAPAGTVAVLTVAGHAVEAAPAGTTGAAEVQEFTPTVTAADTRAAVTSLAAREGADTARLAKARVVVGAGRGAGGPDGFDGVLALADALGGVIGVSRVVTSLGWRPHSEQVGQTGTRISPELYIACGISGAIQHWAGCSSSQTILAVNTDPEAPMVTRARYAVIGDMHEVVPAILEELGRT